MTIEGDGFLYNMVRTIAGMLLAVGNGWNDAGDIKQILEAKDSKKAGKTAPAHGLYLEECDLLDSSQLFLVFFEKTLDLLLEFSIR